RHDARARHARVDRRLAVDGRHRPEHGTLSREEFTEGMARMREFMRRGMPGGPGGPGRGGRGPDEGFRRPPPQE
ncbi:MAG: hypothetical protein ACKOBP_00540, partial [Planctomycetia bacterium]